MVKAYVLIEMVAGHSSSLLGALGDKQLVSRVDRVTGPYDVIATVEASDINEINQFVENEIHTLTGVTRTLTCVSLS